MIQYFKTILIFITVLSIFSSCSRRNIFSQYTKSPEYKTVHAIQATSLKKRGDLNEIALISERKTTAVERHKIENTKKLSSHCITIEKKSREIAKKLVNKISNEVLTFNIPNSKADVSKKVDPYGVIALVIEAAAMYSFFVLKMPILGITLVVAGIITAVRSVNRCNNIDKYGGKSLAITAGVIGGIALFLLAIAALALGVILPLA
jgi:hypothetical protein